MTTEPSLQERYNEFIESRKRSGNPITVQEQYIALDNTIAYLKELNALNNDEALEIAIKDIEAFNAHCKTMNDVK